MVTAFVCGFNRAQSKTICRTWTFGLCLSAIAGLGMRYIGSFCLLAATLVACSPNSRSVLINTCLEDGEPRHICECSTAAIAGTLPSEDLDRMAHFMARKDFRGLNQAMAEIGRKYPAETTAIMQDVAACYGPNKSVGRWPVERDPNEPQISPAPQEQPSDNAPQLSPLPEE